MMKKSLKKLKMILDHTPSNSPCKWENLENIAGKIKRKKSGAFSLIELLVAITIGGIVLTIVMVGYAAMTKTNMRLDIARQMQKELNFATIRIADRVRNYSAESCEEDGKTLTIKEEQGVFKFLQNREKLQLDGQDLFSSNIKVIDAKFSCFGLDSSEKVQPRVQIYLKIKSKKIPELTNWVQTTISSRRFD